MAILEVCDRPDLLDLELARLSVLRELSPVSESERLRLSAARGRVLVDDRRSPIPLPAFAQSAVDGFGIHDADLASSPNLLQVTTQIAAGTEMTTGLYPGQAVGLLTGAPIPAGVAAVIMREKTDRIGQSIRRRGPAESGQNIRWQGEDVPAGGALVEGGSILDARHIAILSAAGIAEAVVRRRIRVGVISNGNELVAPPQALRAGQVYDTNRPMLLALLSNPAIEIFDLGLVGDDRDAMSRIFSASKSCLDLIVSSGGVSGSEADHVVDAVCAAGGRSRRLAIAMKPGKPLAVGRVGSAAIISLPGNCLAAMVGALLFARPMIRTLAGVSRVNPPAQVARIAAKILRKAGRTEFLPVRIVEQNLGEIPVIAPLGKGGSARLRPVILADGFASIPGAAEVVPAGSLLAYRPFRSDFEL